MARLSSGKLDSTAIVIGQNQRRLLRFALGYHVSLIRQSHAAALSGFGLILLIVLRSTS